MPYFPIVTRSLLARTGAALLGVALLATASPAKTLPQIVCGRDIAVTMDFVPVPAAGMRLRPPALAKKSATITLNAGAGLTARPQALAAWNRAVAIWEGYLGDNVTVVIDGDFAALGTGVLGGTSSRSFQAGYDTIVGQLKADRATDEAYVDQLPTAANFNLDLPPGFSVGGNVAATKAALKAAGFDMSFDDGFADATMTFSTGFESNFDYDSSDGISSGKFDFEAIVVHEIGHALGFTSEVDDIDYLRNLGQTGAVTPTTLDLFRLLQGAGAANFTTANRQLMSGDLVPGQYFWDGSQDLRLSTGSDLGDGQQASHWKADEQSGTYLGIMDPTLAPGDHEEITPNDLRAFGVIGWDITLAPPITDCNTNSIDDAIDISGGASQDCNSNGVPDECDIASGTSYDINLDTIPDECLPTANTPERSSYQLGAHPNPFNPRTSVWFDLPRSGDVTLEVFDATGRHVRTLAHDVFEAGRHEVNWNGVNDDGRPVSSGVYFVVLGSDGGSQPLKVTLLK